MLNISLLYFSLNKVSSATQGAKQSPLVSHTAPSKKQVDNEWVSVDVLKFEKHLLDQQVLKSNCLLYVVMVGLHIYLYTLVLCICIHTHTPHTDTHTHTYIYIYIHIHKYIT